MRQLLSIALLCGCLSLSSQKYNFVNWTVEDGLIQSQALHLCQDQYRHLWIGTEGGLSRFDGKKFTGFTVQEGLTANHINVMMTDKSGNIWAGTHHGISVFDGHSFRTVSFNDSAQHNISAITQLPDGKIHALDLFFNLYEIKGTTAFKINISGEPGEKVTALYQCPNGGLLAYVYSEGIYQFNGQWSKLSIADGLQITRYIRKFFITSRGDTLLSYNNGLYRLRNQEVRPFEQDELVDVNILCFAEDEKQNTWLGTEKGVFKLEGPQVLHFDAKRGFTDNSVNHIYRDVENNLWFATDADGIYKFRENTFTYYDKTSGLSNTIIMGVVQTTDGRIYAGGYGGGLYTINKQNDIEPVNTDGESLADSKINCLYADDQNNVWIGTLGKGVWQYKHNGDLKRIIDRADPEQEIRGAGCFLKDRRGNLLMGSNKVLYVMDPNGNITRVRIPMAMQSLKLFRGDSILAGTSKGVYVIDKNYNVTPYHEKELGNSSVLCMAVNSTHLWLGTPEKGVIRWNYNTGQLTNYNTSNGLPSNFIYNLDVTENQKAWIGTGFGISNIQVNPRGRISAIKNYGRSEGLLGMECSHNCLLRARDSSLWFGTTKGLFHFNPAAVLAEKHQPLVMIRSVKLHSSAINDTTYFSAMDSWFNVPHDLKLPSGQNHLTFELGSIYFTNPEDVLYAYKLQGIDKEFTTTSNPVIIYPSLPPGKYTLLVNGITKSGVASVNKLSYTFEIEKAFYQTSLFQFLVILVLISTGALLTYVLTRGRQKRKQRAKELLARIREEEFMKLRQRTAEDFHDEMGNSLTRISVLTDVLKTKINGTSSEVSRLVQQIKENTTALYNGSRDIIWSLNSQNDGIYEITEHIRQIGVELFEDTAIEFNYIHNIKPQNPLKLKLDYSRNLTMIFKEAFSNILKHSGASQVDVSMELSQTGLEIKLNDNGAGFETAENGNGNGIRNMGNRVRRMHGDLQIHSAVQKGTEINILLNNIFINQA